MPRDNAQVAQWFDDWYKPVRRWLSQRVSPLEVDDLAQEVFERLLRYDEKAVVVYPQGYLFRIAANVANEWGARLRIKCEHSPEWLEDLQWDGLTPEELHEGEDRIKAIRRAVDSLPKRRRHILLLHANEGLTYGQIAKRLGLTYRIVLRELTRAYAQLRFLLAPLTGDETVDIPVQPLMRLVREEPEEPVRMVAVVPPPTAEPEPEPEPLPASPPLTVVAQLDYEHNDFAGYVLQYLAERHGQLVSKGQLHTLLYADGPDGGPHSNCIEVFIGRIRRTRLTDQEVIETKRGRGYIYTFNG